MSRFARTKIKIAALIFLFLFIGGAQAQVPPDKLEKLKLFNQIVSVAYQNKKLDEALDAARQALELSLQIYGDNHVETGNAYHTVGAIYQDQNKFSNSIENLSRAAAVFERDPAAHGKILIRVYENLGISLALDNKEIEAEKFYLKSLDTAEKTFGKDHQETLNLVFVLGKFYAQIKKVKESHEFFLRSYDLVIKKFGKDSYQVEIISDAEMCSNLPMLKKRNDYLDAKNKLFGFETDGVLNGKFTKLMEPTIPPAARAARMSGRVVVKVTVDESGAVYQARAICGNPLLRAVSVESARQSKAEPTTKDGKPIKVTGYIFFNFVER